MSLETVVEDIRDEARARADEIRAEGDRRAEEIIEAAEADAEEIIEERAAEVEAQIEQERDQKLSSATLEAKQNRLEARRDLLREVKTRVEERIASLDGDTREALTADLIEAAAAEFDEGPVKVYGRAEDEPLITQLLSDREDYEYAGEYDCLGGIVVESDASRVRVNNTFDSILEVVWEDSLKEISDRLFEDGTQ